MWFSVDGVCLWRRRNSDKVGMEQWGLSSRNVSDWLCWMLWSDVGLNVRREMEKVLNSSYMWKKISLDKI